MILYNLIIGYCEISTLIFAQTLYFRIYSSSCSGQAWNDLYDAILVDELCDTVHLRGFLLYSYQ